MSGSGCYVSGPNVTQILRPIQEPAPTPGQEKSRSGTKNVCNLNLKKLFLDVSCRQRMEKWGRNNSEML